MSIGPTTEGLQQRGSAVLAQAGDLRHPLPDLSTRTSHAQGANSSAVAGLGGARAMWPLPQSTGVCCFLRPGIIGRGDRHRRRGGDHDVEGASFDGQEGRDLRPLCQGGRQFWSSKRSIPSGGLAGVGQFVRRTFGKHLFT